MPSRSRRGGGQGLRRTTGAFSGLYLLNQGDILATAVPGFPVWDLAGLLGSTGWGLWAAALGVAIVLSPTGPRVGDDRA